MRFRLICALAAGLGLAAAGLVSVSSAQDAAPERLEAARFDGQGRLLYPENVDEWVHLGSTIGMDYSQEGFDETRADPFGVVTMEPSAWRYFKEHGEFADGTMFHLSFHRAIADPELNNAGFATGPVQALEIHYYDSAMFEGGDNFFMFGPDKAPAAALPAPNDCIACHDASGAYDSAFVQFYPNMLEILRERGALSD